ncbi:ABC transporter ATP-binding protein [Halorientalis marina]|uniref:ABC transporter ATP-binding protein n=1 Tax=Halorientalis marina TaxID=2931976 RepID=UPI001FF4644B|nr:ABC transporter ATP-binding protein [Halorientalis marina]
MTESRPSDHQPSTRSIPVVACDSLVREYTRGTGSRFFRSADAPVVRALDGVSISIDSGEFVGIAGPSGSGKSTLLHLLAGLDTPTEGTVTLGGDDISDLSERARARIRRDRVGIVFQRFHLLPSLSALSNVALPLVELGWSKARRHDRAETLLSKVGLSDRMSHRPGTLSGGEQQRVAIARALATEPALVIADEPTGELDSKTSARVLDLLESVADNCAVVLASHDQQALDATERRIQLQDGEVIHDSHG